MPRPRPADSFFCEEACQENEKFRWRSAIGRSKIPSNGTEPNRTGSNQIQ